MVVSAVDLLYVFGRSFVLSDELTLLVQFGRGTDGDLVSVRSCLSDRPEMWVTAALNNMSVFILV